MLLADIKQFGFHRKTAGRVVDFADIFGNYKVIDK